MGENGKVYLEKGGLGTRGIFAKWGEGVRTRGYSWEKGGENAPVQFAPELIFLVPEPHLVLAQSGTFWCLIFKVPTWTKGIFGKRGGEDVGVYLGNEG